MAFLRVVALAAAMFVVVGAAGIVAPREALAQPVRGTCASCGSDSGDANCGACMTTGRTMCFNALDPANRIDAAFHTSDTPPRDGRDPSLRFARLVGGAAASATDFMRAVNSAYGGSGYGYYGDATTQAMGYCAPEGGPAAAFTSATDYTYGWNHALEDTFNHLDCYNGEVDRWYFHNAGHSDGDRVCDGEQALFDPSAGAIFDLGGEANRVAVFPFTDHPPLPCESFEYSVWLSDDPHATAIADAAHPDPTRWNPAVLTRAFLQGWIPDADVPGQPRSTDTNNPNLANPTQRDGYVQVFALPCGLTFRYASIVAGNNGSPSAACTFYSFDAELDAALGLNEDDTALCPDADGDGFRDVACGGTDCNDHDPAVHPGAYENCSSPRDLDCDGTPPQCPTSTTCYQGFCAPGCIEGGCATGFTCVMGDAGVTFCLPAACVGVTCPPGQLCGPMGCQDPCMGAACPTGQVCRNGSCLDPCAGYACPTHQHCAPDATHTPLCVADCSCLPCGGTGVCNATSGRCEAPGCSVLRCAPPSTPDCTGTTTTCVTPCGGVTCPLGQVCDSATGHCNRDGCFGVACQSGFVCQGGMCIPGARPDAGRVTMDAGSQTMDTDAGLDGGAMVMDGGMDGGAGRLLDDTSSGCGCDVPRGHGGQGAYALTTALALAWAGGRRWHRAGRHPV